MEAVATAVRHLLDQSAGTCSRSGAHPGSVRVRDGVDLTAPILEGTADAETGCEFDR